MPRVRDLQDAMPCPYCDRLRQARSRAFQTVMEAQTVLDRNFQTAAQKEYRRLRASLSEAQLSAVLAEAEADRHERECKSTRDELGLGSGSV